jgi:large subunit ribosomal protein L21
MTFSIIKTGGKQYLAEAGKVLTIEKLPGDVKVGDKVTFSDVLLTEDGSATKVGLPLLSGAKVTGTVKEVGRAKKIAVIKYKPKVRYFKNRGHRQPFVKVVID